jgi:hypothetical protein
MELQDVRSQEMGHTLEGPFTGRADGRKKAAHTILNFNFISRVLTSMPFPLKKKTSVLLVSSKNILGEKTKEREREKTEILFLYVLAWGR